nr:vitellogenin [Hippolyte inermis]
MTSSSLAAPILLALLTLAAAAPWPSNLPKCSTECSIAGSPKLHYSPEKTYVYSYSGRSTIKLKDVEDGNADMQWSSQVELTWLTPCDMAITVKNPSVGGGPGSPESSFLERYPLVVAMTDGRVQRACTHPDDDVWSINFKKGIASAFQNSLPSNSSINSGLNFTETDIIGNCSTRYEIQNEGDAVTVNKIKNHRFCQDLYINQAETPRSLPKSPLPMEESVSECKQQISKGIYSSITCKDRNIIRPSFGSYKYVEAHQESTLRFHSETDQTPDAIMRLQTRLIPNSLRYDQQRLKKDPSAIAKLDNALKQICEKTKEFAEEESASYVAQAIHYLRRVPEEAISQTLQKIREGQICSEKQKLESLFLDGVAFIQESGAVKVMVQELLSGRATGGRTALYAAAIYFTPRPCLHSITALQPLIEEYQRFPRITLAAASMVNTYCRHNPRCQEETPVRQLAEALSNKVSQKCSAPGNEKERQESLALLKALANMGVMNEEIARPIISCIRNQEADNSIRMASTHAFRNVQCQPQLKEVLKQLVNIAVDPTRDTEVRIGSYLAAIKCADFADIKKITSKLSTEENTQVRGFIMSHLLNIQESSAPYKENLRYLISTVILPANFTNDIRKYSQNVDLSYYAPTFGVGAGMESNVIYAPGSYIPRSLNLNLTAALGATPMNFGEFGVRFEGLESIIEDLLGPEGYLKKKDITQVLADVSSFITNKYGKIKERFESISRERRSIDFSQISHLFDKLYGNRDSQKPKADFYARMGDQEIAFASLAGDLKNINVDQLIDSFFDYIEEIMNRGRNANINSARAAQIYMDYHIPTMQGVPLKMKFEGTTVASLKLESSSGSIKFKPSMSTQIEGFVGFDYHVAQVGLKMKNRISTAVGSSVNMVSSSEGESFNVEIDIPDKMELINLKSQTYLLKAVTGQPEHKIIPSSAGQPRFIAQSCSNALEPAVGLKLCYDINIPNIFRGQGLPLGPLSTVKVFLEKSESGMKGYRLKTSRLITSGKKEFQMELETRGSQTPRKANAHLSYTGEHEMKKVEFVLESQTSGGIKVELKHKSSSAEKMLELDVYSSPSRQYTQDSKEIEASFRMTVNGDESNVDTLFRTLGVIRQYVDVNFEASGDFRLTESYRIPVPKRLRKFEYSVASGRWNAISFIRKSSDSQYSSAFKFGQMGNEVISVVGTHNIEGSSYWDLSVRNTIKATLGSSQFATEINVFNNEEKRGVSLQVSRQGSSTKVLEASTILARSGENYNLNMQLDVPSYIKALSLKATASSQGSSKYMVDAHAKHGGNSVVTIEGPVTARLSTEASQTFELSTQLRVTFINSSPYGLKTSVSMSPRDQLVQLKLTKNSEDLMDFSWTMKTQDGQQTSMDVELNLPSLIKKSVNVIISEKVFHLSANQVLMPKSSPIRMKGFVDVDFEAKKAQVDFAWDADRSPNKKVKAEVSIIGGSSTIRDSIIHGGVTYLESTSQFKAELNLANPNSWFTGRNSIKLDITTPSQKAYKVNAVVNNQRQSSGRQIQTSVTVRTPESNQYKWNSDSSLQWLGESYNMKITTQADFSSPKGQQTHITLDLQNQLNSRQRDSYLEVRITNPSLQQPIKTRLVLNNQQGQYKTEWKIEMTAPADGAMYELRLSPEGGVQSFKVELDLKEVVQLLKSLETLVSSRSIYTSTGREAKYLVQYNKPTHNAHKILVKSPSRSMEGEAKYSDSEVLLRFKPNQEISRSKYELYAKHSSSGHDRRFEGHVSHPALERDWQANVQYSRNEQKVTGSLELDIFPNPADMITGSLESTIVSDYTAIIEAKLTGKALKTNPRLVLAASNGPRTTGFDIMFQKTPSSPVSLQVSGKLDNSYGRYAASSFIVKTEGQSVVDISLSARPHQSPSCYGVRVEAKSYSSQIGTYDVSAELCKPAFIEIVTRKHDSDRMYVAKIGLEGQKNAEISISEADPETLERQVLGMARVVLSSPSLLNATYAYENEQIQSLKNAIRENWSRLSSSAAAWLDNIAREVLKEGSGSPSSKFAMLWQEVKDEASRIYEDLKYDRVIPSWELIKELAHSQIVRDVANAYYQLWSKYAQLQETLRSATSNAVQALQREFDDVKQIFNTVVIEIAQSVLSGEIPMCFENLWNEIQESSLYRRVQSDIESSMNNYPEDFQGLKQIVEKIKETLRRDISNQRKNVMAYMKPRRIIEWIVNKMSFDRIAFNGVDKFAKNIVQTVLFLPIRIQGNQVQIELPLHRPVYSLPQAVSYVSLNLVPTVDSALWSLEPVMPIQIDNLVGAYYSYVPRHVRYLLPPYNRTAVVADGTEILTFDGAILRAPRSPCKVLLAQYKTGSLVMQNSQATQLPHFFMKVSSVAVEVKPDFKVFVNGQEVSGDQQVQDVKVHKTAEKIEVLTPFLSLRVYKQSLTATVEASGWTFGRVAGLLGTYDGEMGNDWMTPSGSRASSLQELVRAWQEDQQCQTPSVTPVNLLQVPVQQILRCNALLGARSRCHPVVRPEAFVQMCYPSRNACNVARAYSAVCSTKGVKDVFPLGC